MFKSFKETIARRADRNEYQTEIVFNLRLLIKHDLKRFPAHWLEITNLNCSLQLFYKLALDICMTEGSRNEGIFSKRKFMWGLSTYENGLHPPRTPARLPLCGMGLPRLTEQTYALHCIMTSTVNPSQREILCFCTHTGFIHNI